MLRIWGFLKRLNDKFSFRVARVSSWRVWMTIITVGPLTAIAVDSWVHRGFNPASAIMTAVVLVLTIQTSIDAQAQRLSQAEQRKDDEKRDAQWMEQLCAVADLTVSIREVLDQLELAATETVRRDEAMAKRDEAMRDLSVKILDSIEDRTEGVTAA